MPYTNSVHTRRTLLIERSWYCLNVSYVFYISSIAILNLYGYLLRHAGTRAIPDYLGTIARYNRYSVLQRLLTFAVINRPFTDEARGHIFADKNIIG